MEQLIEVLQATFVLAICFGAIFVILTTLHHLTNLSRGIIKFLDRRKNNTKVEIERRGRRSNRW